MIDFNKQIDRANSDSIKWNKYPDEVLPLWVADTDFLAPESVIQALQKRISSGHFGYHMPSDQAVDAVRTWLINRYAWEVDHDSILLLPGVVQSFNLTASALTRPGDGVLIQTPAYHPFFWIAANCALVQQENALLTDSSGHYYPDIDQFNASIDPITRIFILCNPQNPTGRVFNEQELRQMAEVCLERNIIICSDEIHSDVIFSPKRHLPIASLSQEISNQTVTLLSPSKTFNLAGLNISVAIITNPKLRELFQAKLHYLVGTPNLLGTAALEAAYTTGAEYLESMLRYLEQNRDFLVEYVNSELPGISICCPEGTYLGWLNCEGLEYDDPAKHFLDVGLVALNEGSWFGEQYQRYARINFACPRSTLASGLERIKISLSGPLPK